MGFEYPKARRSDFTEELHGKAHPDPYRWMEDPDAPEVKEWVCAQNKVVDGFIDKEVPFRSKMREKINAQIDYPKHGIPFKKGPYWYYWYNTGLQNQSVLFQKKDIFNKEEEARVFLDPNTLSEDGTTSISRMAWAESGKHVAFGLSKKGTDWSVVYVKDCTTLEDLPDKVEWVKYSGLSWTHDGKGFFYARYPLPKIAEGKKDGDADLGSETEAATKQRLMYHYLGDKQDQDPLVYFDEATPTVLYGASVTDDGCYCIISVAKGCDPENKFWYINLKDIDLRSFDQSSVTKLIDEFSWSYDYIGNRGTLFYFMTTENAGNKKVITIDIAKPDSKKVVIEEESSVLDWCDFGYNDAFFIGYLKDVKDVVYVSHLSDLSKRTEVPLELGSVSWSSSEKHPHVFYSVTSITFPKKIYSFNLETDCNPAPNSVLWHEDKIKGFDSSQFVVDQVFFTSKDGTRVPMFITHRKDMKRDGSNLTMMYGYGGFHVSETIYFSASRLVFLNNLRGVYVQVNIRGGGEYGEEWWKGGSMYNKINSFDDFLGAAEWLQDNGITRPDKLALYGASNGGTLVAACANMAPERFGCGVAGVGVMDMLRFHKFTIGATWRCDFGDPDKKEDFDYILKYSPLHNISANKKYPAILCQTGDHDDRVAPLHTFKYLAELQHHCGNQEQPLMAKVEIDAGHGGGKPLSKVIDEITDRFSFIAAVCKAEWRD
eukprot:TRINITY_DN13736_c3_g1_i1.p1 TRINITY_DN13736_c3_g1~~TRINITY_DN13736_c3_g1_i1.p1  ORF type:complete len:713 (+),score=312.47 TRINITY_DN13736_c3_g1_i1:42-2180(+)